LLILKNFKLKINNKKDNKQKNECEIVKKLNPIKKIENIEDKKTITNKVMFVFITFKNISFSSEKL